MGRGMLREKLSCHLEMLKTTTPPPALSYSRFYITSTETIQSWLKSEEDLVSVSAGFAIVYSFLEKHLLRWNRGNITL